MKKFCFLKNQQVLLVAKEYFDIIYGKSVPHSWAADKTGVIWFDYVGYKKELEKLLRNKFYACKAR